MIHRTYWDTIFGNPPFVPHPEVMTFAFYMEPPQVPTHTSTPVEDIPIMPEELVEMPIDIELTVHQDNAPAEPAEPEISTAESTPAESTSLVPVDSVVYSVENDDTKPKKSFFRRKK